MTLNLPSPPRGQTTLEELGQKVTVSGPIVEIGKPRYDDPFWREGRGPVLVQAGHGADSARGDTEGNPETTKAANRPPASMFLLFIGEDGAH